MKTLKTILLNVHAFPMVTADVITVEDDLHAFYEKLQCDLIELPQRKIGDKYFTIMCDEEGAIKMDPICSAVDNEEDQNPMLFGSLMFFNDDGEGDLTSLTDEDIGIIMSHIKDFGDYKMLVGCEY